MKQGSTGGCLGKIIFQLQWEERERAEEEVDNIQTRLNRGCDGLRGGWTGGEGGLA